VPFDVKIPRLAYLMIGRTADGRYLPGQEILYDLNN